MRPLVLSVVLFCAAFFPAYSRMLGGEIDLSTAVVVYTTPQGNAEKHAPDLFVNEVSKRTGIQLSTSSEWRDDRPVIAIASKRPNAWGHKLPIRMGEAFAENHSEGFRIFVEQGKKHPIVWVIPHKSDAALFAIGRLMMEMELKEGSIMMPSALDIASSPRYAIRGHQIGYRNTANTYDAWTKEQYEQYFIDMALYGTNSIETIQFYDKSVHFKYPPEEMQRYISELCDKYELQHWCWTTAEFDLEKNIEEKEKRIKGYHDFFKNNKRLDALFFPGGDPGDNHPSLVFAYLEQVYNIGVQYFPHLQIWVSQQGFKKEWQEWVYSHLREKSPKWLTGLVNGPSSPNIDTERLNLPPQYRIRTYPDITHNLRCQFGVKYWDQAFARTLSREAVNPRPDEYKRILKWQAPYSDGAISYSDGSHDDVNKMLLSELLWNPDITPREVCYDYAALFFGSDLRQEGGDAILSLENNWTGTLLNNGAVHGTYLTWQKIEKEHPRLADNWRFQMLMLRAVYDEYVRVKLIRETALEAKSNDILLQAPSIGADKAIALSLQTLNETTVNPTAPELKEKIVILCEALWQSIGLQSSVAKYKARDNQRGAVLDFVDQVMNNKLWLEDEFAKVKQMGSEQEKINRLLTIAQWENPGAGSYYDDIGNRAKMDNVLHADFVYTRPIDSMNPEPLFWARDAGFSRHRLSWQVSMDYPEAIIYEALDPNAQYIVRMTGFGQFLLSIDGEKVLPIDGRKREIGEVIEFNIDRKFYQDGKITLTMEKPTDEAHLNWRQQSFLTEVWLIKR